MAKAPTTPRKAPRQDRAVVTVDAMLEAAERIVESDGFDKLTTDRIAERAGVSVGTLYQYFPNKQSIFVQLVERYITQMLTTVEQALALAVDAPLGLVIEGTLAAMLATFDRQRAIQPAIYAQLGPLALEQRMGAALVRYRELVGAFLRARRDLALAPARIEAIAFVLVHAFEGLARGLAMGVDTAAGPAASPVTRAALTAEIVRMVEQYLA